MRFLQLFCENKNIGKGLEVVGTLEVVKAQQIKG